MYIKIVRGIKNKIYEEGVVNNNEIGGRIFCIKYMHIWSISMM